MSIWRWRCGAAWALRISASGCCRQAGTHFLGEAGGGAGGGGSCEPSSGTGHRRGLVSPDGALRSVAAQHQEVNKDRLYRGLDHLLAHKDALEAHLSRRCGELFAIQNEVLLYDVTSTYFEGLAEGNPQAQRGYSRDHRPDCKQV